MATAPPGMGPLGKYPPPAAVGGGAAATALAGGRSMDAHAAASSSMLQDLARDVGQQVEAMILKEKRASETKVRSEIQKIRVKMESLTEKANLVHVKLQQLDRNHDPILKADLMRSIEKLEEVWEGEFFTLKHELWQTIQAHNHNADLMKHHKAAIDQVQSRVEETSVGGPEVALIQEQLAQVDRVMQREKERQRQIDELMTRLSNVQYQLTFGGLPAGLPMPTAPAPAGLGVPMAQVAGKKAAPKKNAKAKAQPKGPAANAAALAAAAAATAQAQAAAVSAMLPSMRAEAPEFVPTVGPFDGNL